MLKNNVAAQNQVSIEKLRPCLNISKPIESNMTQKSIQSIENLVSDNNANHAMETCTFSVCVSYLLSFSIGSVHPKSRK